MPKNKPSVQEQIASRKQAAEEKNFYSRNKWLVSILGPRRGEWDSGYYNGDDFTIDVRDGWDYSSDGSWPYHCSKITYKGELVFHYEYHEVQLYIPGSWEAAYEQLEEKTEKLRLERQIEAQAAAKKAAIDAETAERKKWKL